MTSEEKRFPSAARFRTRNSFGRIARTSMVWGYARTGVHTLVAIPTAIALARLLSPTDFGIAATATFFGQLAAYLSSGGLGPALVRMKDIREDHISSVFAINVVMSALGALALIASAPYIAAFYNAPEVRWILPVIALNFVFGAMTVIQQALLARDLRYREMATIGSLDVTVASCTAVVLAALGFRYWSLVIGEVCGAFVKWIYGAWLVGSHLRFRFVPAATRELISFAMGYYIRGLVEQFSRSLDKALIGRWLGVTSLGFYSKAQSLAVHAFTRMTVVGAGVSFRVFAIIQDDPERFKRAYRKIIMTVTLVGYVVLGGLAAMGPNLIVVAFGERWGPSVVPFQIFCLVLALRLTNKYTTAAANARGWIWPLVGCNVAEIACVVVGVYVGSAWGITGVAVGMLITTIVTFLLMQSLMRAATGFGLWEGLEPQMPALLTAAPIGLVLWVVGTVIGEWGAPPIAILAAQTCAIVALALAFAWWCPFAEVRELMHEIVSDISPRLAGFVWSDVAGDRARSRARRREAEAGVPSGGATQ